VARIMVVETSAMWLRRTPAMQDSSRLASPSSSPGGRDAAMLPWMTEGLDSLCSQEQSLYPYGPEENDI